jgi:hypothetical protein
MALMVFANGRQGPFLYFTSLPIPFLSITPLYRVTPPHRVHILLYMGNLISLVFQNIDPPSPSPPGESVLPLQQRRGVHTRRAERGMGGSIFWKTREIGLPSYSKICTRQETRQERYSYLYSPSPFLSGAHNGLIMVLPVLHKQRKRKNKYDMPLTSL